MYSDTSRGRCGRECRSSVSSDSGDERVLARVKCIGDDGLVCVCVYTYVNIYVNIYMRVYIYMYINVRLTVANLRRVPTC